MLNRWVFISMIVPAVMAGACHAHRAGSDNTTDSILHLPDLSAYTNAIRQYPDSARLYYARSNMLFGMKQYALAREDLQKAIHLQPATGSYLFALGEVYLAQDSAREALQYFSKAAQLDTANLSIQLEYANALYQAGQYGDALQHLQRMQQLHPSIADIYGLQSQVYRDMKDTTRAIAALQKGVQLAPGNYDALMAMGDLLSDKNDSECLQWYDKARKLDTTNAEPLYSKALFFRKNGRITEAVQSLEQSIAADGNYTAAYIALGTIYRQQKQLPDAIKIFNLAEKMAPSDPEIYLQRGYCYQAAGNAGAASADFRRALALNRNLTAAREALDSLQP